MKKPLITIVSFLLLGLNIQNYSLQGVNILGAALKAQEISVGLGDIGYPPFYFYQDAKPQGASYEITQAVADMLGYKLVIKQYPWARLLRNLHSGKVDMAVHLYATKERASFLVFTEEPHIYESNSLFVRKGSLIQFSGNLNDLKGLAFGQIEGYSYGEYYDDADFLNKEEFASEGNLVKMLSLERIDIAVASRAAIMWNADQLNLTSHIEELTPTLDYGPAFMAFSRANPEANKLAKQFTNAIVKFKKQTTIVKS